MTPFTELSFEPRHISISKSGGIEIDWKDGHRSRYPLQHVRDRCPCAACNGAHPEAPAAAQPSSPFSMYKPRLKIDSIEQVGNYALRIRWNDGHDTGIYSWEHFRNICPCPECVAPGKP